MTRLDGTTITNLPPVLRGTHRSLIAQGRRHLRWRVVSQRWSDTDDVERSKPSPTFSA